MNFSAIFARIVALIGGAALLWRRRLQGAAPAPALGAAPVIPAAKPQGSIPTLKMPTARGWRDGQKPIAAPGLKVNAFATGLEHRRWITVLANNDVLVAEATKIAGPIRSLFTYVMQATMRRAAALGVSANRIILLRDQDGDASPGSSRPTPETYGSARSPGPQYQQQGQYHQQFRECGAPGGTPSAKPSAGRGRTPR
jgi:glucose/arabinose dehydrogenase